MSTKYYSSPRWTGEIADCSMPMTMDTYSNCSYKCKYCFSQFQRALGKCGEEYLKNQVHWVNPEKVKRIFKEPESSQFGEYIKARRVMQWGGLSDQFDENERKYGVTLELLRFFREIDYPISFSTKATWWLDVLGYEKLANDWDKYKNVKISTQYFDKVVNLLLAKASKGKDISIMETTLCAYRKLFKGSRYLGYYTDRVLGELNVTLKKYPEYIEELSLLYIAREQTIPDKFLGEKHNWKGIRKELKKYFIEQSKWEW